MATVRVINNNFVKDIRIYICLGQSTNVTPATNYLSSPLNQNCQSTATYSFFKKYKKINSGLSR
jgi:hypothetical protein